MKKFISSLFMIIAHVVLIAQEKEGEESIKRTIHGEEAWTNESKMILVCIFAIVILIFVLRTFRNKSDA